jgi:hypothetical protein
MTPLLLGLALAVAAPQAKDRPKDESALVGEWELESRTEGGAPGRPILPGGQDSLHIHGGRRVRRLRRAGDPAGPEVLHRRPEGRPVGP